MIQNQYVRATIQTLKPISLFKVFFLHQIMLYLPSQYMAVSRESEAKKALFIKYIIIDLS